MATRILIILFSMVTIAKAELPDLITDPATRDVVEYLDSKINYIYSSYSSSASILVPSNNLLKVSKTGDTMTGDLINSAQISASRYQILGNTVVSTLQGNYNTGIGLYAGIANQSGGVDNTFVGYESGLANTTADDNTMIGYQAGKANVATGQTMVGSMAGLANVGGAYNTFIGFEAGKTNSSGAGAVCVGAGACYTGTGMDDSTMMGFQAGYYSTARDLTFVGMQSGFSNTSGQYNSFFGWKAGYGNTTGSGNSAFGNSSGISNSTASYNTLYGYGSGYQVRASSNTMIGYNAGYSNYTGQGNIAIGFNAASAMTTSTGNIHIGMDVALTQTSGSNNIIIGSKQSPTSDTASNELNIGGIIRGNLINGDVYIGTTSAAGHLHIQTPVGMNSETGYSLKISSGDSTSVLGIHPNGHISLYGADSTVISSMCANGTMNAMGGDVAGRVTFSGANSGCEVRFGSPYDSTPACVVSGAVAAATEMPTLSSFSPYGFTFIPVTGIWDAGDAVNFICLGMH